MSDRCPSEPAAYVPATEQLVVELFVRNIRRSVAFYQRLGFTVVEDNGDFVALSWEQHRLFLDEQPGLPPPDHLRANVRIMVPDVDRYWAQVHVLGARVVSPIADRDYGIRDFTVTDPDGFGLRFGSWIPGRDATG
jgi:catechol 2,3-dioxygenase-like lactoylglutathione lyase family enzyme